MTLTALGRGGDTLRVWETLQGYLAHKKPPHPRNLQRLYVVLWGVAFSYERGIPVSADPGCFWQLPRMVDDQIG